MTRHLGVKGKIHVVGHDISVMVAHALVARFSEMTKSVAWGDFLLLETEEYDKFLLNVSLFTDLANFLHSQKFGQRNWVMRRADYDEEVGFS